MPDVQTVPDDDPSRDSSGAAAARAEALERAEARERAEIRERAGTPVPTPDSHTVTRNALEAKDTPSGPGAVHMAIQQILESRKKRERAEARAAPRAVARKSAIALKCAAADYISWGNTWERAELELAEQLPSMGTPEWHRAFTPLRMNEVISFEDNKEEEEFYLHLEAALAIQSVARGFKGRRIAEGIRLAAVREEKETAAVVKQMPDLPEAPDDALYRGDTTDDTSVRGERPPAFLVPGTAHQGVQFRRDYLASLAPGTAHQGVQICRDYLALLARTVNVDSMCDELYRGDATNDTPVRWEQICRGDYTAMSTPTLNCGMSVPTSHYFLLTPDTHSRGDQTIKLRDDHQGGHTPPTIHPTDRPLTFKAVLTMDDYNMSGNTVVTLLPPPMPTTVSLIPGHILNGVTPNDLSADNDIQNPRLLYKICFRPSRVNPELPALPTLAKHIHPTLPPNDAGQSTVSFVQPFAEVKPADLSIDVHTFDAHNNAYLPNGIDNGIDTDEAITLGPCPRLSTRSNVDEGFATRTKHNLLYILQAVNQPNNASHSEAFPDTGRRLNTPKGPKKDYSQNLNLVKTSLEDISSTPSLTNNLLSYTREQADHGSTLRYTLGGEGLLCLVFILWISNRFVWKLSMDWKRYLGRKRCFFWTVASSTIIPVFPSSDCLWHSISRRGVWGSAGAA